jgi:CheY-like chemotaxis protein
MAAAAQRILVIDDEVSFSKMVADFLGGRGYAVEVAHDGLDGFRKATRAQYDLVLADINMPGMNGVETIQSLRMVDSPVQVVVVSGYITPEVEADCRKAGCAEVLTKPVELSRLGEVVAAALAPPTASEAGNSGT